jgi:sensor histidine kinase YesM
VGGNGVSDLYGILRYGILFASNYVVWVLLIEYLYGSIKSFQDKSKSRFVRMVEVLLSLALLVLFHLIVTNILYYTYLVMATDLTVDGVWTDFQPFLFKSILSRVLDVVVIVFLIKLLEGYWTLQKQKLQVVSLENQLHLSQLEALRAQLDPHFLFNTLHTLHALIGYDDRKAKSMLIKVTSLMRKTLEQRGRHLISLEEELEYVQNYLDIEQERFHDRLNVILDMTQQAKQLQVPALILQPLIENAFKHGISLLETAGEIRLSAQIADGQLVLELQNSVPLETKHSPIPSNGLGLTNLKKRLTQEYGKTYTFSADRNGSFFVVRIQIEIQKDQ